MTDLTKRATAENTMANSSSGKGSKRRNERNILTFYEKIAVIRYYDETSISRNSLAKMFHCCATQIRRILEKKQELLQQLATLSEADASIIIEEMTRKRRKFEMCAISFILHQWVERCRQLRLRKSITNQVLKDTALKMAAILNLPTFRPSYRWLNRFRGKYKYNAQDLGIAPEEGGIAGELAVEDIIIEFKNTLPSFMQKEISAITALTAIKLDDSMKSNDIKATDNKKQKMVVLPLTLPDKSNDKIKHDDDDDGNNEKKKLLIDNENDKSNEIEEQKRTNNTNATAWEIDLDNSNSLTDSSEEDASITDVTNGQTAANAPNDGILNAGSSALLNGIFPHLAVIHQFALLNSDVKALELISQLGVHMQTQAATGAYKNLTLATPCDEADIDDIVLME